MLDNDPLARVLYVDLSRRSFSVKPRPDLFEAGLGGTGAAIRLLEEECAPGTDPFAPGNPIILTVGPLTGLYPLASKTIAMFKSPHTGNLGESHAGGRSAVAIRMAGYGAIVIRGASVTPVYLSIEGDHVHFRDASALWGRIAPIPPLCPARARAGCGRAHHHAHRPGRRAGGHLCLGDHRDLPALRPAWAGAVFGSKRLKGLVIAGRRSLSVADRRAYRALYDDLFKAATQSSLMKKYHELGTAMNVLPLNAMGALPTRNLQQGHFEGAEAISGEHLAEAYLGRRVACAHCPVACIHLAAVRFPYPKEPYFYKTSMIGYDHEPLFAVGSLLGGATDAPDLRACSSCWTRRRSRDWMS